MLKRICASMFRPHAEALPSVIREATEVETLKQQSEARAAEDRRLIRRMSDALVDLSQRDDPAIESYAERIAEMVEARQMASTGPWIVPQEVLASTDRLIKESLQRFRQRESNIVTQGALGDIELALQNVEWRREVNTSWLEFSRWGIQQIILICRLHYVKHPWIRRGTDLSAAYVFGQGVELSSPDPDANDVLKDFREHNKTTLGQIALVEAEKRKSYDGNLFWCLFSDTQSTGKVNVRLIDATEIQEIWHDPNDADKPWFYRRVWTQRTPDLTTGQMQNTSGDEWYPSLEYATETEGDPVKRVPMIGLKKVNWDTPVYHRKVGAVANWAFGCPRVYPALDWSKEGRKHLERCSSVTAAQAQIALQITTKGGQQALEGIKQQWQTTVGPTNATWDQNPPAVAGSTFASGPGTQVQAFKTRGTGADPAEVKEYRNMAACGLGIPPTWLGDMETSNLSTAQTLDRPTELGFLLKQEEWQEDLVVMGRYALKVSLGAPSGRLHEVKHGKVSIREADRKHRPDGHWIYAAAKVRKPDVIEVLCAFPAIREGDIPALVGATLQAMAIDRLGNQHGLDDKTAVRKFCQLLDIQNPDELVEKLYPEKSYIHDRTLEPEDEGTVPAPAVAAVPGVPVVAPPAPKPKPTVKEVAQIRTVIRQIQEALPEHTHQ